MDVIIVYPIGGLLAVVAIGIIMILIGIFQGVTSNPNVIMEFAQKHTDGFMIFIGVVSVIITIIASVCFYKYFLDVYFFKEQKKQAVASGIFRGVLFGLIVFNSIMTTYCMVIGYLDEVLKGMSNFFFFILSLVFVIPISFAILILLIILTIAPNFLYFLPEMLEKDGPFMLFVYPAFISIVANSIYIFLLVKTLPMYL